MSAEPLPTRTFTFPEGVFLIFIILLASDAVSIAIGWFSSSDMRGWWPFVLWFWILLDFAYGLVFMFLTWRGHMSLRVLIASNAALAVSLLVLPKMSNVLYGLFIVGAAIWRVVALRRSERG